MKISISSLLILFLQAVIAQNSDHKEFESIRSIVAGQYSNAPVETKKSAYSLQKVAKTNEEKSISYRYLGYIYNLTGNVDSARYFFQKQLQLTKEYFLNKELHYQAVIDYVDWGMNYVDNKISLKQELISNMKLCFHL